MITAMLASTANCRSSDSVATVPRVMAMISAERTKSVRMAPLILSFSSAAMSTCGSTSALAQLGDAGGVFLGAVQEAMGELLEALEAEEGAADHQQAASPAPARRR